MEPECRYCRLIVAFGHSSPNFAEFGEMALIDSYFESFQMKPCRQFNFKQPDCKIWESFPKFNSVSFHPVSNRTQGRRGEWVGERLCTRMVNLSLMNPAVR